MLFEKISLKSCCGGMAIIYKLSLPVNENLMNKFITNGFKQSVNFMKSGILYVESQTIIASGPFGADKLTAHSKFKRQSDLDDFEILFKKL